jgi:hypothetical protein
MPQQSKGATGNPPTTVLEAVNKRYAEITQLTERQKYSGPAELKARLETVVQEGKGLVGEVTSYFTGEYSRGRNYFIPRVGKRMVDDLMKGIFKLRKKLLTLERGIANPQAQFNHPAAHLKEIMAILKACSNVSGRCDSDDFRSPLTSSLCDRGGLQGLEQRLLAISQILPAPLLGLYFLAEQFWVFIENSPEAREVTLKVESKLLAMGNSQAAGAPYGWVAAKIAADSFNLLRLRQPSNVAQTTPIIQRLERLSLSLREEGDSDRVEIMNSTLQLLDDAI